MIYTASRDYGDKSVPFLCFSLFVPKTRGSLDYARDDGTFFSRHFDQTQCVEKSPKAEQYLVIQRVEKNPKNLLERTPICGEVCVASEVFLRKVKFVYDK